MSRNPNRIAIALLVLLLAALPAAAQDETPVQIDEAHDTVRKSLVHVTISGTPGSGDLAGQPGAVSAQGTGFFVSSDGFILTAAHLMNPLIAADTDPADIDITVRIGDASSTAIPAQFINKLSGLDLMLLRASLPFDQLQRDGPPPALEIGYSDDIDPDNPPALLTSGFQQAGYDRKKLRLIDTSSNDLPFGWTIGGKSPSGQSGSPIYILRQVGDEKRPFVVGLLKGTSISDDERSHMIPIEFSLPLIGHLKMRQLEQKLALLESRLGPQENREGKEPPRPIFPRLRGLEGNIEQIGRRFEWDVRTNELTGELIVSYTKLITGGPQIGRIDLAIVPWAYTEALGNRITLEQKGILQNVPKRDIAPSFQSEDQLKAEFVIPGVQNAIERLIIGSVPGSARTDPVPRMVVQIRPWIGDQPLDDELREIRPSYNWNFDGGQG